MDNINPSGRNKGGRPPKNDKRNKTLSLKCTAKEMQCIQANAKLAMLTVSEYLREKGCHGQVVSTRKTIPSEVLQLTGTINHMAANLNQLAKKRNTQWFEFTLDERLSLSILAKELKATALQIFKYLL